MSLNYTHFVDPMHLLPVVGYPMSMREAQEEYERGELTFGELALLSAFGGAVTATHMILAAQHSYLAAVRFQTLMTAAYSPLTYAGLGVVVGSYATMTPGADVSIGPYGSVRVIPHLGIFS